VPEGFIVQPTYRIRDGVPVVQLHGRLTDGRPFLVEEDRFRPYFFVREKHRERAAREPGARVEPTDLAAFDGEPVCRVEVSLPGDVPTLRDRLWQAGIAAFEADLRFPYRFLIDHGIRAGVAIEGEAESRGSEALVRFRNPQLAPAEVRPELRVLSIDLETPRDASCIWSAALVGDDVDEVHLLSKAAVAGAICHETERDLLEAVCTRIRAIDPDILTGWNVVDFDLQTWSQRGEAVRCDASLGRVPGRTHFQQDPRFTRQTRASIPGRVVVDGIPLVRDALRLEDYRLDTVARAVVGRQKQIDHDAPDAAAEIARMFHEDREALVVYNREDARLVLDILAKEGLLELAIERSALAGMPLDRIGASVASFDRLYLPELRARGRVAPSVDAGRENVHVRGGAVLDSKPGLFSNVALFDFKSLYPSLMRTFQLDPLAHALAREGDIEAPNGARFAREGALLPAILERLMASRDEAKARSDRHADQAIKIMMNSLFGVLGTPGCRFFDPDVANAITGFGQEMLARTQEAFASEGVEVLYGDTDSVFVQLAGQGGTPRDEAGALRNRVQQRLDAEVEARWGVESRLLLELESVFDRFFMPRVRGGKSGSKKRYAASRNGELHIVGLESVRRDWPAIAGRLQRGLLERVFAGEDPIPFARAVAKSVRAGEVDEELVYAKRVRKASLESYTATTPPHVRAARKAGPHAGPVIRYLMTRSGPEPALPGRELPGAIDYGHYLERVLRPVAESIFDVTGGSFDEALDQPTQMSLL
jgi:DNA polymerase-2